MTAKPNSYPPIPLSNTLKILSWNVHGFRDASLGQKTNCPEFLSQLTESHIFLLQETKGPVEVDNYICYNKCRQDPRSGGLTIGVLSSLQKFVTITDTKRDDMMAITISRQITGTLQDLTIVNIYDSPPDSSYKKRRAGTSEELDTLYDLQQLLLSLKQTEILVGGVGEI